MSSAERATGEASVYGRADVAKTLDDRLRAGAVPVAVYGLNRTALPLAATLAGTTGNVVAADTDEGLVEAVREGEYPYTDVDGVGAMLSDTTASADLSVTASRRQAAAAARVHVVSLSTPMDGGPDLSDLRATLSAVAEGLTAGDLVVVEGTVPVGTCRDELYPILVEESSLSPGQFGFAFTPQRFPSSGLRGLESDHNRVIAGIDGESEHLTATLYESVTDADTTAVPAIETAEMAALVASAYRTVTTALSNELARHAGALDADVTEVVEAVNERADCALPVPNLGVAEGHHPGYIEMLRDSLGTDTRLLDAARVSNDLMPTYATVSLFDALETAGVEPTDASVLVVGLDQRAGLGGDRVAPSLPISRLLATEGVEVSVTGRTPAAADPYEDAGATVLDVTTALDREYDAVVLGSPTLEPPDGQTLRSLGTTDHRLVVLDGYQLLPELRNDDSVIYNGIGINA